MCLLRNLPFILNRYSAHPKLGKAWKCVQTLLQICEIVTSYEITELEVQRLEETIELHLKLFKEVFGVNFIPKQHFLLHYGNIVRKVGPLRHFNMMRYDAKHRPFKKFRNTTNNFKNINKTLAEKHQQMMYLSGFTYRNEIEHGVLRPFGDRNIFNLICNSTEIQGSIYKSKFVYVNSNRYAKGLLVVHQGTFFEIDQIIYMMGNFYISCSPWIIEHFDSFLNSFKIKKNENVSLTIVKPLELVHTKSYQIKSIGNNDYVISDSLDLRANVNQ